MRLRPYILFLLLIALFTSCGTTSRSKKSAAQRVETPALSAEEQRRFDYYFLEAIRLKAQDEYDSAFELLQHCIRIDPNASSALFEISQYYQFLKMPSQALRALEAAVANAPENYWYAQALANLYLQQGDQDKSIALFEKMSTLFPDRRESLFMLIDLYARTGENQQMISTLDRIEALMGKSEQLSMEKFRAYLQMNETKKAFEEVEGLVAEYPMDYRYQILLGDLYLQNSKPDEAYQLYDKVLTIEPDNPVALLSLASYYEQTSQPELYQQQLNKLLLEKQVPGSTKLGVMQQLIMQNEQANGDSYF